MPDFDNNGATIHYELMGSGSPLLCIAGIASDSASWAPLVPLLADRYRLIMIDNRGCGRTKAPLPLSIVDMANDCAALLDKLGLDQADVLAHSMGGIIANRLAVDHPTRVRRLVTMTTTPRPLRKATELMNDMEKLAYEIEPQRWFRLLFQWLFSEPFFESADNLRTAAMASTLYAFRQSPENFAAQHAASQAHKPVDVSRIACPVLVLAGERDIIIPPDAVKAQHAPIPNHRFELVPNAAHSVHWEAPEAVAKLVRDFLA
jgi:pimeloyl-ACP methyl ester carboxylesterase